tara:strand:+ start:946 stop:1143 length:198 start_codon:yes stop_codon:yes gene_type:complete
MTKNLNKPFTNAPKRSRIEAEAEDPEPKRYWDWMGWKLRQEDMKEKSFAERVKMFKNKKRGINND